MNDRDAFLRAILAEPDNDTPRLAYADFLEEQSDGPCPYCSYIAPAARYVRSEPHCDTCKNTGTDRLWRSRRAAFIRHQIAVDRYGARPDSEAYRLAGVLEEVHSCLWAVMTDPEDFATTVACRPYTPLGLVERGFISRVAGRFTDILLGSTVPTLRALGHPVEKVVLADDSGAVELSWDYQWDSISYRLEIAHSPSGHAPDYQYYTCRVCRYENDKICAPAGYGTLIERVLQAEFLIPSVRLVVQPPLEH